MKSRRLRSPLQRRNLTTLFIASVSSLVLAFGLAASTARSPRGAQESVEAKEREVVDRIPKHVPIKVKIKKLERLKDAENEGWPDDMEIEVTNTGAKPIYFLNILLDMPDVLADNGTNYVFEYYYGRVYLADFGEPVQSDDVPLQPGETATLKPADNWIKGWKSLRAKGRVTNPKKLVFKFQEINHGDGTGFLGTGGTPMPMRRERIFIVSVSSLVLASGFAASTARSPRGAQEGAGFGEREVVDTVPAHVPIKVKVKNQEKLKDAGNTHWARDFEIEVRNTGDKPIYYIFMVVVLPDVTINGYSYAFLIDHGRRKLGLPDTPVEPEDVPIMPGESVTLKIPDDQMKAYEETENWDSSSNPKRIEIEVQAIKFGDGTSFQGTKGKLWHAKPKERSSNDPRPKGNSGTSPHLPPCCSRALTRFYD